LNKEIKYDLVNTAENQSVNRQKLLSKVIATEVIKTAKIATENKPRTILTVQ